MVSSFSARISSVKSLHRRATVGVGTLLLTLVLLIWFQPFVPVENITRDPAVIAGHPAYYGALSNLGVLLWSASVTACLVGALVIRVTKGRSTAVGFFAAFGSLSFVLCLDDLFLLHEWLLPVHLGLPETVTFAAYAIALLIMLLRFRKILIRTQPALLALSLLLFAISTAGDLTPLLANLSDNDIYALEDGSKFLAIFVWFSYFLWAAVDQIVTSTFASAASVEAPISQLQEKVI